jgi:hypothetical protein
MKKSGTNFTRKLKILSEKRAILFSMAMKGGKNEISSSQLGREYSLIRICEGLTEERQEGPCHTVLSSRASHNLEKRQ